MKYIGAILTSLTMIALAIVGFAAVDDSHSPESYVNCGRYDKAINSLEGEQLMTLGKTAKESLQDEIDEVEKARAADNDCKIVTEPTVVDLPEVPGIEDLCNPEGVTDNVTWSSDLAESTDLASWAESADGKTRTATLAEDNTVWSDESSDPLAYHLTADNGDQCDAQEQPANETTPAPTVYVTVIATPAPPGAGD